MDNKEYELLGFIQGDGQLCDLNNPNKKGVTINLGKDDYDIDNYFRLNKVEGDRKVYYNNKEIIGLIYNLKFSTEQLPKRKLPCTFDDWEYENRISFMRGLYSANGSVLEKHKRITFKTTCLELAEQIKQFWIECGLNPYITTNKSKSVKFSNGEYICKESYDVNLCRKESRKWFYENVGFIQEYKNIKLKNSLN